MGGRWVCWMWFWEETNQGLSQRSLDYNGSDSSFRDFSNIFCQFNRNCIFSEKINKMQLFKQNTEIFHMLSDTLTLEVSKCKTYTTSNIDIGLTTIPILLSYQIPNTICISILASFLTSSLTVYFNLWITGCDPILAGA